MAGLEIAHTDRTRSTVDTNHVCVRVHLDIEPLAKHLGRSDHQRSLVSNDVTDVIWQPAVGECHVGAAIEDRNLRQLVKAPESRGTRRASGYAANNQDTASGSRIWRVCRFEVSVMVHRNSNRNRIGCLAYSRNNVCPCLKRIHGPKRCSSGLPRGTRAKPGFLTSLASVLTLGLDKPYSSPLSFLFFLAMASARILSAHVGQILLLEGLPQTLQTRVGCLGCITVDV